MAVFFDIQGPILYTSDSRHRKRVLIIRAKIGLQASRAIVLFEEGIAVGYLSNITGNGWRKLIRRPGIYNYRITNIPPVPSELQFMVEQANLDAIGYYVSLNMGAGFAVFVPEQDKVRLILIIVT